MNSRCTRTFTLPFNYLILFSNFLILLICGVRVTFITGTALLVFCLLFSISQLMTCFWNFSISFAIFLHTRLCNQCLQALFLFYLHSGLRLPRWPSSSSRSISALPVVSSVTWLFVLPHVPSVVTFDVSLWRLNTTRVKFNQNRFAEVVKKYEYRVLQHNSTSSIKQDHLIDIYFIDNRKENRMKININKH